MSSKPLSVDQTLLRAKSCLARGELLQAQQLYQSILDRFPKNKKALTGLKNCSGLIQQSGKSGPAQNQLSSIKNLYSAGRAQEALTQALRLYQHYPNTPVIANLIGAIYLGLGNNEEAAAYFRKALELEPGTAEAYNNLGDILNKAGKYEEACNNYHQAVKLKSDYAVAYNSLGNALTNLGRYEEAVTSYTRVLELRPDEAEVHYNLGNTLKFLDKHTEAAASFKKAVTLNRNDIALRSALLAQLGKICDWSESGESLQTDIKSYDFSKNPASAPSPFGLLALFDDAELDRQASEAYVNANYMPKDSLGPLKDRRIGNRIRVGYFSADFYNHATMYLMAELFERHDHSKFEIHAFSFGPANNDEMHTRLIQNVEHYHDVRLRSDAEIARLSRSLGIDIAVDLKGFTKNNRAGIFSYRAAPIQVNYLGYPGTMGATYFDYLIADPILIPPEYQKFYSEKIAYLPDSYQINDRSRKISEKNMSRSEFGLTEHTFVFCCFNNNYKIKPDVFKIWMHLLGEIKDSILWLLKGNPAAEQNLRNQASLCGIDPDRLVFAERAPLSEHLARHRLADLFLDTFNCNAHTTASDALWAGLPLLTKLGQSFASRVGGSLLNAVGLPELITGTAQEYQDTALMLATNPDKLRHIRDKLENNLLTCALFDSASYTRHIEAAFTQMARRLDEGLAAEHFYVQQ